MRPDRASRSDSLGGPWTGGLDGEERGGGRLRRGGGMREGRGGETRKGGKRRDERGGGGDKGGQSEEGVRVEWRGEYQEEKGA